MRLHLDVEIVNLYVYDGAQMVIVIDVDLLVHLRRKNASLYDDFQREDKVLCFYFLAFKVRRK